MEMWIITTQSSKWVEDRDGGSVYLNVLLISNYMNSFESDIVWEMKHKAHYMTDTFLRLEWDGANFDGKIK